MNPGPFLRHPGVPKLGVTILLHDQNWVTLQNATAPAAPLSPPRGLHPPVPPHLGGRSCHRAGCGSEGALDAVGLEEGTAQGTQHRGSSSAVTLLWAGDGGGRQGVQCWGALGTLHVLWGHHTCHGDLRHSLGTLHTAGDTAPCLGTPNAAEDLGHFLGILHTLQEHCATLGDPAHSLGTLDTARDLGHSLGTLHTTGTCQPAWALHIPGHPLKSLGTLHSTWGPQTLPGNPKHFWAGDPPCFPQFVHALTPLQIHRAAVSEPGQHSFCSPALIPGCWAAPKEWGEAPLSYSLVPIQGCTAMGQTTLSHRDHAQTRNFWGFFGGFFGFF